MKVTLPKDINKTQRKVGLRSWITLLIGAAALLGLFFLLRLPGLPPVPCLLTCCVLAAPVILLAFGTMSGLELTVIIGRLWRDLIYNANRRPFQRRD